MSRTHIQFPDTLPTRWMARSMPRYRAAIEEICVGMRESEIRQHIAFMCATEQQLEQEYDPGAAADVFIARQGVGGYLLGIDGRPVCAGGFEPSAAMPGVWSSWMCATDDGWDRHWRDITRGTRWMMAQVMMGGARRLETCVLESRVDAQSWFTDFLGMQLEGRRRAYCPSGEDVLLYSFTRDDWRKALGG